MKNLRMNSFIELSDIAGCTLVPVPIAIDLAKLHSCVAIGAKSRVFGQRFTGYFLFQFFKSLFEIPKEHCVFLYWTSVLPRKSRDGGDKRNANNPLVPVIQKIKNGHMTSSKGYVFGGFGESKRLSPIASFITTSLFVKRSFL